MSTIQEVLARRTDLSTFLVHLTKAQSNGTSAKTCLENILTARIVNARRPFGLFANVLAEFNIRAVTQHCVCFTETPLEHVKDLLGISNRQEDFEAYGIAVTKKQGRRAGVNPIMYLDTTAGHDWLTEPLSLIAHQAAALPHIQKILPFIDTMGSFGGGREFSWEREWRCNSDFNLPENFIILCPEGEIESFEELAEGNGSEVRAIDPNWSLEQIIAHLANFDDDDIGFQ